MKKTIVIGGGAAGMMAAYTASKNTSVILLEKNEKLGKKLYITGKGRCNLSNDSALNEFLENVVTNPKFLYGSLAVFSPSDTMNFFENSGLSLKVERGKRVFPASDRASDVTKTLEKLLIHNGVDIRLNTNVESILVEDGKVVGVSTAKGRIFSDSVIVCTGGISYPLTGSTGDGYKFALNVGHEIVAPRPALVGIDLVGGWFKDVQGLSLKNVTLTAKRGEKVVFSEFGEMLFTHFGISGPIVLSCSSVINKFNAREINLFLDLKPALDEQVLENRLLREFQSDNRKNLASAIRSLLPKHLVDILIKLAEVNGNKNCSEITAEMRKRIVKTLKNFPLKIQSLRPIEEAIVTSGGVSVKGINPKTMESKLVNGLFFAGEVVDVDAFTGGYNIQIAFSTGYLAGLNV